jgi:hypothetical protein
MKRLIASINRTASVRPELVCYLDFDDNSYDWKSIDRVIQGPRIVMSEMWNVCAQRATGDILMMAGDDMVFGTPDWDVMVEYAFRNCPDRILMVHGADGKNTDNFGCFPTVHRKWVDAVGYFVPPCFGGDYSDTWLNDVANILGRRKFLPYVTEHLHPVWGKAPVDETYTEKWKRDERDMPSVKYASMSAQRTGDADKLRAVMRAN